MKTRPHDPVLAQREEAANMTLASKKYTPQTPAWCAETRILDLQDTIRLGLMDCYEGFDDDWAADWWSGFPGPEDQWMQALEILRADHRYAGIRDALLAWGFDLDEELRDNA